MENGALDRKGSWRMEVAGCELRGGHAEGEMRTLEIQEKLGRRSDLSAKESELRLL